MTVGKYTYEDVWAVLVTPGNTLAFQYEWLDRDDQSQGWLQKTVLGCKVTHNYLATVKRTAKLDLIESADEPIDWLNDRIRPWIGVKMPAGDYAGFPQGVFVLNSPERSKDGPLIYRDVDGYDKTQVVLDSSFGSDVVAVSSVTIPALTVYTDQILLLLSQASITQSQVKIVDSERQSLVDRTWTAATRRSGQIQIAKKVAQEAALKKKLNNTLTIINHLITALHYEDLWFDGFGNARVEPYIEPYEAPINHKYDVEDKNILTPKVVQTLDLFSVPNVITFCVSQPDRPMLVSRFVNSDPASPVSTTSLGRRKVLFDASVEAATQSELDGLVRKAAINASNVYEHVKIETMINPMHSNRDIIELYVTDMGLADFFTEMSWEIDFKAGGIMKHDLRRLVNLNPSILGDPNG
jgi:hypothetical protein